MPSRRYVVHTTSPPPPTQHRTIYAGDYAFSEADVHGRAAVGVHVDGATTNAIVQHAVNAGATNAANANAGEGDATTKATGAGSPLL